jgi:hypothetical protein
MISVVPSGVPSIVAVPFGFARLGVACNGEQAYENDYCTQSQSDSFQHND